jgi:hypothetical protein
MEKLTKKHYIVIGVVVCIIAFYFYKKNYIYLDPTKAHLLIQQGATVVCKDKTSGKEYYLTSNQFVFPAGGLYFYSVGGEVVTTSTCIED